MNKTHWKKLTNPDYLGAYAFEPKQEFIATIKYVAVEKSHGFGWEKRRNAPLYILPKVSNQ